MNKSITIYTDLKTATISYGKNKKNKIEVNVKFDRYTCEGYLDNTHKITFYLNEIVIADIRTNLENILEVGHNEVTRIMLQINPWYFMSESDKIGVLTFQKDSIEYKRAIRDAIAKHNPTTAKFGMANGIF